MTKADYSNLYAVCIQPAFLLVLQVHPGHGALAQKAWGVCASEPSVGCDRSCFS